ncbi:terminase, partial [Pseudonocardia sp. Ae356_Ps1]|uniref:terminase n=1 Tax=Pseudonocardia sp. Ae356_Ps1 TaxID=1885032 RepID=UPI000AA9FEB5
SLVGSTMPRLWSRPLIEGPSGKCGCGCSLSEDSSFGFEAVRFAGRLGERLLPWQRWWLIHALERRQGGGLRYRTVLTLVARQNGKSFLLKIVALWAMASGRARLVLGVAQSADIARESWQGAVDVARDAPVGAGVEVDAVRRANGEQCLTLGNGSRYRIAAATRSAGRGLSVDLLILDELREHRDWGSWSALSKTTSARPDALTVGISNAGDDNSVVLNSLRAAGLSGEDESLGLFEWSAPDGVALDDRSGWVCSNPALGHVPSLERAVCGELVMDPPAVFRTERLCQRVEQLNAAVDVAAWRDAADPGVSLEAVRDRVGLAVDVAPDGLHVTAVGAAVLDDGRVRVEVLGAWESTDAARRDLFLGADPLVEAVSPYVVGWFPGGPAGALSAEFRGLESSGRLVRALAGGEVAQVCQGFADLVAASRVRHPGDPLLDAHLAGAQKLASGDGWRFTRNGVGHVDAAYAVAGAVHVVRTVPLPERPPRAAIF